MDMTNISAFRKVHPYYIHAPAFRETSAGIVVLHTLCHLLNTQGYDAYIVGTDVLNPKFNTSVVTREVLAEHNRNGLTPIVVYPEIVSGNPLNASVCVRYILNRIGRITGKPLNEGKDDLFFYYSENFLGDARKEDVDFLYLSILDTEIFKPDPSKTKDRTFVFQYRYPLEKIDFSLFPAGTELISMANPVSLHELAAKLQTGRVLYSYEISAVCPEAMMCGCPVVFMHDGGLKDVPDQFLFGTNGAAMVSERNGLARAAATVGAVYPAIAAQINVFWSQLPTFIEKTQGAAREVQMPNPICPVVKPMQTPKRRICALSNEPTSHRWTTARVSRPFSLLADQWELHWPIRNNSLNAGDLSNADVVLMQRVFPATLTPEQLDQLFAAGKPVIYETNEPFHNLPDDHPFQFVGKQAAPRIEQAMRRAQALIVPTRALADALRPWNANIHVLPTYVDFDLFYSPVRTHFGKVRIGLMGSATKQRNFALISQALSVVRARFAGEVQFVFVGALPPADWMGQPDVTMIGISESYEARAATFRQLELDIGLMPLAESEFSSDEPRSEWLEYSAAGVVTIGSDHQTYHELDKDHCTGLRVSADSPAAWVESISQLIENPAHRRSVARTAQASVRKLESLQTQVSRYHETYLRCMGLTETVVPSNFSSASNRIPAVLILDAEGDAQKVERSMVFHAQSPYKDLMTVVLTTSQFSLPDWTDTLRYLRASTEAYAGAAEQVCAHADFDWKTITEAGTALLQA